jgi:hypothetical protein
MNKILISLIIILCPVWLWAACTSSSPTTWTCTASSTAAQINTCISGATTGDVINVGAGTNTWGQINITKPVTLVGAGVGNTVIAGSGEILIRIYPSDWSDTTHLYRVSGFSFNLNTTSVGVLIGGDTLSSYKTYTTNTPSLPKVRIDHNRFYNSTDGTIKAIENRCHMSGVVDNNTFDSLGYPIRNDTQGGVASINSMWQYVYPYWALGNQLNIYYEDNTFTNNPYPGESFSVVMDGQYGARYVARYNTITLPTGYDFAPLFDQHGEFGGDMRAGFGTEVYGNLATNGGGDIIASRGPRDISFFNQAATGAGATVRVQQDACPADPYALDMYSHDTYIFRNRNGATGTLFGYAVTRTTSNCLGFGTLPTAGREFFTDSTTPAVGCGTLANLPGTCTVGQGYWATSQSCTNLTGMVGVNPSTPISGTLYKCTATNTWTEWYSPYTYPHPLRGATVIPASFSGTNIIGGQVR